MPVRTELPRRAFLAAGAAMASGMVAGMPEKLAARDKNSAGSIDAHSHIWTRDVQDFPLAPGVTVDDLDPPSFTAEELLDKARPEGVDRVVLIAHHTYYGFDNRYLIDAARRFPGTFKVVALLDDSQPHPDTEMKRLHRHHVTGFRITPALRGANWLDNRGMRAMWKMAAETGQAMCCLINPENLPQVDRMCGDYPETRVVIDHFARIGIDGQIRKSDLKQLCRLARFKNTFVKISAYYALGRKEPPYHDLIPMIRRLCETFGPQRLMWGSDAPYQVVDGHTYEDSISLIRDQIDFVSQAERAWLLRETAQKVFFT